MNKIIKIKITNLHPFEGNPFTVKHNTEFEELVKSIKEIGIITPLVVREIKSEHYEIISRHRRLEAAQLAGITDIPVIIKVLDKDAAIVSLVDSNLNRENIPPSEKAFAYKMKLEAIKHQGKSSTQVAEKLSVDLIGEKDNISGDTVWRYIRLTNLLPELLEYVDNAFANKPDCRKIALSPAVALSYLTDEEQFMLLDTMDIHDCTPSHSQSIRLKKLSQEGLLDDKSMEEILSEEKPNQVENFKFPKSEIRKYFPKSYTDKQIYESVLKVLEQQKRKRDLSKGTR